MPEILDGGGLRDLRQVWLSVFGRTLKKDVGDGDEGGAGKKEEAATKSGEPEAGGCAGASVARPGI